MEINYPLEISPDLKYKNNPTNIVILDARQSVMNFDLISKLHCSIPGVLMYGFHYYIQKDGDILGGRPERALPCNVEYLMSKLYNIIGSENNISKAESDTDNILSANKIFICLEGNTSIEQINNGQRMSLVNLCQDIMGRYRNIKNVYSMSEYISSYDNLGSFVDMNELRSNISNNISNMYVDIPSGSTSYTFGKRKLYYDADNLITGNDVKTLQTYLNALNFPCHTTNGIFDVFTYNAVSTFQKAEGFIPVSGNTASGYIGQEGIMNTREFARIKDMVLQLSINHDYSNYYRFMRYNPSNNMYGDDINKISNKLMDLGYLKINTGKFDNAMYNAIKSFQQDNHLNVTGEIGPIDWKNIMDAESLVFDGTISYVPNDNTPNKNILYLQKIIKKFKDRYSITVVSLTGYYDETTYNNVRKIQLMNNFAMTGDITEEFWKFLLSQ